MQESKWVVDSNYLKHISAEIKTLKEKEPKDRLEMQFWMMACCGMILQHMQSSFIGCVNNPALLSGILEGIDEPTFRALWEEYRKLALHMLKVDEKLTKTIPTSTKEQQAAQAQIQVKTHDSNPLVS